MAGKKKNSEETDTEITLESTWKSTKNLENKVEKIAALCIEMREMHISKSSENEEFKLQLLNLEKLHNMKLEEDEIKNKEIEDIKLMNILKNKELDEIRLANLKSTRERKQENDKNKELIESEIARLKEKDSKRRELPVKRELSSEEDSDNDSIGLDSDGEIPDYSQYSKEQLELQALKSLAKKQGRKDSNRKVTLTKNMKTREENPADEISRPNLTREECIVKARKQEKLKEAQKKRKMDLKNENYWKVLEDDVKSVEEVPGARDRNLYKMRNENEEVENGSSDTCCSVLDKWNRLCRDEVGY
eukprot:GHVR01016450.1.p1 GENE.GHVR01016450.1~~GHVR01016450.1.p1  ORF type:complete len:304 (+),score=52.73 GHVR01016450.1:1096-2007(+)